MLHTQLQVLEWAGVPLTDRSFEEVCAVVEHSVESRGDSVELLVCSPPPEDHAPPPGQHPPSLLFGETVVCDCTQGS